MLKILILKIEHFKYRPIGADISRSFFSYFNFLFPFFIFLFILCFYRYEIIFQRNGAEAREGLIINKWLATVKGVMMLGMEANGVNFSQFFTTRFNSIELLEVIAWMDFIMVNTDCNPYT